MFVGVVSVIVGVKCFNFLVEGMVGYVGIVLMFMWWDVLCVSVEMLLVVESISL